MGAQGPGSTRQNNGPFVVGGFYNLAPFSLVDGQACALQLDVNGNLKVTSTGGGGGSNASVGLTGQPAPASATEIGVVDAAGNLQHVTGLDLTNAFALTVAIVDGNGNQISSFGGGTQYPAGTTVATPTGTVALGQDSSNVLHALATDASGNLIVNFSAPQHVIVDSGTISVTQGTSPWVVSFSTPPHTIIDSGNFPSIVDPNNSSTTPLGSGATFTGTATDLLPYKAITVAVFANTAGTLQVEWSEDSANWDFIDTIAVSASSGVANVFTLKARYFRIVYTNGGSAQGTFRLQTLQHPVAINFKGVVISTNIVGSDEGLIVSAVLSAQSTTSATTYLKLKSVSGSLLVAGVDGNGLGQQLSVAVDGTLGFGTALTVGGLDGSGNSNALGVVGKVLVISAQNPGADGVNNNNNAVLISASGQQLSLAVFPSVFNGTTWDRLRSAGTTGILGTQDLADGSVSGGTAGTFSQLAGGIFNSVAPVLTNGQQASLQLTAAGALIVSTGGAGGGTSAIDESSFIIGSSSETPIGGVFLGGSNVPTLAINQTGAVQLTADRKMLVSDPAMTILLDYMQTLILETRAMRSAIVYMITENQDVQTSDFDPSNQDFQPVN